MTNKQDRRDGIKLVRAMRKSAQAWRDWGVANGVEAAAIFAAADAEDAVKAATDTDSETTAEALRDALTVEAAAIAAAQAAADIRCRASEVMIACEAKIYKRVAEELA